MLQRMLRRIEYFIAIVEALYDKFRDWVKLVFLLGVWALAFELILKLTYELPYWVMYAAFAGITLIFTLYKVKKTYRKLLILCAIPFFGIFPLVLVNGEYWVACLTVMVFMFLYFTIYREQEKDSLQVIVNNRTVFAIVTSMIGLLFICTIFLSVLSLPFTFLGYYKIKWTIKSYKQGRTLFHKILRVILAVPVFISCVMLMFMASL